MGVLHTAVRPIALVALLAAVTAGSASGAQAVGDSTPPQFTYRVLAISTSDWIEHTSWGSKDDSSGVDHAVARWRTKEIGGAWGPWHKPSKWKSLTAEASISKHFRRGHVYQIQVRVFDRAGNHTAWTAMGGGVRPSR